MTVNPCPKYKRGLRCKAREVPLEKARPALPVTRTLRTNGCCGARPRGRR